MVLVGVYFGGDSLIPDGIWGLHADAAAVGPVHRKPRPGDIPPTWISPALHPKSSVTVRGGGCDLSSSSLYQGLPCCRAGRTHTTLSPLFLAPLGDPQPFPGF